MKKRAIINFIVSIIYQATNLLIGLILPKYYTEIFGSIYNGLNQSVSQIMSLLSVLQLGIAAASIQQMFQHIAKSDNQAVGAIYWSTGKQYRKMGYIFLMLIVPIIVAFPFLIADDLPYYIIVLFLSFKSISAAMEYFFQAKYGVILSAHNLNYVIYIVNILLLLLSTALHFVILFTTQNIILYQFVSIISVSIRLLIMYIYIHRKFPYLKEVKKKKNNIVFENSKRNDVLVSEIAGVIIDSTDLLILTIFVGLVDASIYSVYNFVVVGLASVISSCREAVFAGIGKIYYQDKEAFKKKMARFESVYLFLTFFLYCTALLLFKPFIETYTGNMDAQYYYVGLPIMFICSKLLVNIRIPSIVAINTAGHFKQVKYYAVAEAAINLIVSLILVTPLGIYGVLIGTIAGAAFRTPILIWYANKNIIERASFGYIKKILSWLPLLVLCFFVGEFIPLSCTNLLHWIGLAIPVAIGVLFACFLWSFILDKQMVVELKLILSKIVKKQKARGK